MTLHYTPPKPFQREFSYHSFQLGLLAGFSLPPVYCCKDVTETFRHSGQFKSSPSLSFQAENKACFSKTAYEVIKTSVWIVPLNNSTSTFEVQSNSHTLLGRHQWQPILWLLLRLVRLPTAALYVSAPQPYIAP